LRHAEKLPRITSARFDVKQGHTLMMIWWGIVHEPSAAIVRQLGARVTPMTILATIAAALAMLAVTTPGLISVASIAPFEGLALGLCLAAAWVLLLAPPIGLTTIFVLLLTASHMQASPFVLPAAGIEWHPRELLLGLLLAGFGLQLLLLRVEFAPSPIHLFVAFTAAAYALMLLTGVLRGNNVANLIQEARYPLMLTAYIPLAHFITTRRQLYTQATLILAIALAAALASIALFLYMFATGNIIVNVQNHLGEYVQRQIGPFLLQSARPNAHMYFEVGVTILVALLAGGALTWRGRLLALAALPVLLAAIAITMMRTAYAALAVSLAVLALMSLPVALRRVVIFLAAFVALFALALFGFELWEQAQQQTETAGVSLKGRFEEIAGAGAVFQAHPWFGGGFGSTFEAIGYVARETRQSYAQATHLMVHNIWLYLLFKGGLAAFALASIGMLGLAATGWRLADRLADARDSAFARGLTAALIGQYIGCLAMPRLIYPYGHVFLALVAVALLVLARMPRRDGPASRAV